MQNGLNDIENKNGIKVFVDEFYSKIRRHSLLGPVFGSRISPENWPAHLERMYDFWNAILFSETGFQGNPMEKHLSLPIAEEHFAQWLGLFTQAVDENFRGPKADEAKKRAASIAQIMHFKIVSISKQ